MANDKQYRVTVDGESQLWDADKYERNKDKLTSSYPDAKVEEVGYMSANEEQVIPGEKYRVIIGDEQQEWDSDKLNRNKGHLLQQYPDAKIERLGVIGSQNQPEQNDNIETNFFKGLHQMNKNIWQAGLWHSLGGEIANLFTGSSREEQAALNDIEYLESVGIDPREYLANVEEAEFQKLFGMNREQFDALDKSERKRLTMDAASMQSVLSEDAAKALAKERKQRQSVIDAYQDALAEAGGDLDKAKEILKAKAEDKTWGDKQIEKANAIYAENKELQGAAKWGGLAASAIPSAAALGLSFLTKGKSKGISKWLNNVAKLAGNVGMAGMSAGTAGLSMIEARQHGATNWETWTTGIADGLIEFITEKIPFDKLTKPVLTAAKTRTTKALMDAMRRVDSPGRKELEKLLTEANKKLGGKLLNGKNVADWLANAATEAVSEATAEALQTVTSMIYLNPEEYPTFSEIALNAWEGAKGGFALGGVLGGAGKAVEHSLNKDRRKQQGFVNVALVEQEGKNPFVAELVDYDPETKTYKALLDGEIVDVNEDEIQYKHQYTYNEFESGRYRQLEDEAIADGTVSDAQVAVSADRLGNARQKLENLMTEAGMTDEQKNATFADLEAGDIPGFPADAKTLWDAADEYSDAFKRDKNIQSARNVKAENERKAVLDAMTQQMGGEFWQKGSRIMQENGMEIIEPAMVEVGTMKDGKQVFILSTPNENGEVSAITEDGKKMFVRHTDLQDGTTIMPLQEYLDARVSEQKKAAEQARMAEEAAPQLDVIRQKYQIGARVNLGTEDSPTLGQVIGIKPENDGVFIQTEAGVVPYTYEQLADIEGTPIRVMTDAQMAAAEAAEIEAAESARMSELAETPEQMTEAETVVDNAVQMENLATETPLPLNPDGSVNQDALFKESPARWAEWNDERKQDGGASSAQYISGKLAKAQARLAKLQTAYAVEDSLNKKELLEKAVAEQQGIVDELAEIMQKYAPAETAPVQTESVQPALAATQQERTTESVLASLNDGTLTDEEIRANIEANLAEAQKAYDKYTKKAPKMGTDKDAYLAEKQKYEQGLPALQQEIDFWNGVKQTYEGAMQQDVLPTEESFRAQLTQDDMEPRTPAELAASELGIKEKGIKLLKDSFKAHTGYGSKEASRFFGLFRTKEKGGMTIEAAGDRLMEIDAEYGLGILDQNDPMAGVNAILDLLGDVQTMGDISNYIARNREAQAAKEAAAAYSAMNADFEAAHGMTMEEWAHANEVQRIEIMSKSALTDAEEYERNVKFAEEENQYGTNEQSTGTEGVSGGEDQRDAGNVEGGFDSLHRQGDSILQEAQSDNTGGETISDGQTSQDVSEGNDQDGDTSVYGSEQAAEVDDLPPAYSGVKRAKEDAEHVVNPLAMTVETHLKIMEETREAIHERVNTWSDKLGIKINIIDNYRDVQNKDAKKNIADGNPTFGWFERSTGEIFIYVPDYLNYRTEAALKEVEKTILHEGIAHKGMLEMLGEEKYGELCDKVWSEVMTEKQKKEFIKYPGVNGDTRAAADEFIASVSENVKQDTVWDKIANFFKDILNSIGIEIKVADNDLKGLLKQSYRRFRKGGAKTNPGSNRQAEGNTSLRSANGSLVGMHNISEDKLRKVLKQGGLANPSTAVVNISEYLLDGYGDISLIMPSSLVDANTGDNIGTYTGDAWTPTYPPISRKVDNKGWKVIKDLIRSVVSEDSPLYHDIINGLENYLEDNRSSKMEFVFLKEKGIEPEIAYKGADGFVGMRNLEAVLGVQGLRDGLESYERYKNASPMAKRSFNMWLDAAGNKQAHKELKELIKKEPKLAEVLKLNENVSFAEFDSFTYDIFRKEQDAGKIDTYDTMGAAARYVDANNLRGEFEAWLESLIEQAGAKEVFFAGYTRDGDRIYKDNTLENVSRHMRLQGRTNAYDDHGLSATKSALLQRLTSLSQIRKNKARLQNESVYNKEYDALKGRLWSIISQLAEMQEISSNRFMNVDYAESRLQESFTKKNPIAHLNKEYGYDIDPAGEYADELNSFIKDVQQMPAKYFETKFERPVYLNEFAAAVMPTTTSEDIKQAVSEAGLPIFEYDSAVEGSRKEATLKATEGEGIRFRTLGEKGAANLDKAEEATIRLDNLGVARQMEEAGKDAKAIKLATGWERGADNLWRYEVADDFDLTELENRLQENLNDGLSKTWGVLYPSDLGDLTKAYPDFNVDIMVWVGDEFENTGEYSPATEGDDTTFGSPASIEVKAKTVADIKDVLVHEIQHAIQEKEGFAEGGSVFGLKDKLSAELDKRVARIKELREEGRDAEADELMSMSKGLAEAVINNDADTYQNYRKLAGEVEARNVSARLRMSEQERRESLLSETEDVAREDQIVLMDGLGVSEMGTNMFKTRITPEQDKAYMDAVEAGDMETAQRMVIEAAKLAMPNTKVVDENGNPKVVYHGTGSEFYTFRKTNDINELGAGYYFSDSYEMAERYATDETLADNRLRAENLAFEIFTEEMGHSEEEYDYYVNEETEDDYNEAYYQAVKRLFGNGHVKSVFLNIENPFIVGSRSDDLPYRSLWQQTDEAHRVNDGIIDPEFTLRHETLSGNQYVAFKPSQIKSAEPVTYDDSGNVIPLSERFNEEKSDIRFKTANNNQAIFVSNAAKAVEGIKMEKATPEQWLKMIEKNGGLKAGEDKWMGLSDFLKASDKKTLTKQEVIDFVNEHMIQIEEVHYDVNAEERASDAHSNIVGVLQNKFNDYVAEYHEEHGYEDEYDDPASKYAIERLRDEMEDTFPYTIELVYGNEVYVTFDYEEEDEMVKWAEKTGVDYIPGENPINSTRLNYTTDGLNKKHEIALTVPTVERWGQHDDIHFGDAGDGRAVAWIRFGETKKLLGTTEVEGKKKFNWARVLVIDEIQSKRHQEGREKGYARGPKVSLTELRQKAQDFEQEMIDKYHPKDLGLIPFASAMRGVWTEEESNTYGEMMSALGGAAMKNIGIPDAPFDKNWHELAMKRMLRYAAENGYDVVAWTKGDQQAERYNIGGVLEAIQHYESEKGRVVIVKPRNNESSRFVVNNEGLIIESRGPLSGDATTLSDVVGKELASKIMSGEGEDIEKRDGATYYPAKMIKGEGIRIGGEGMKGFYDKILPAFMNKYGKKWGVKVEDIHLNLEGGLDMHSVPVTEEMKGSVMEGQTMFRTKQPHEFTKQFMQDATNEFYETYNTFAPASVVYANSRKMIEDALGFDSGKMPDWVYDEVKKEAKTSPAYLVTIEDKKEDDSVETRRRILIFANDSVDMSSIVDWMLFHENTHAILQDVGDKDSMLKLGEWLLESDNKHVRKIADWVKATYEEDAWAEEMLCEYVGKMLAIGRGQWAVNLVPEEYKPILNEIYGKFGYRPEQEDGRRDGEISRDIRELQMRNSELEGTDSNKTLFRTGISPEVRKEMDVISAQAIVNGNYMKAPNGKDSKLTPEQWAMVRTKNFKNWFGDWENDPANASKVVDENGEPMVVYHGSPYGSITTFDRKGRTQSGLKEFGTYFTTNKKLAELYAYARQQAKKDIEAYEAEKEKLDAIIFNPGTPARIALDAFDELDKLNESQKPRVYEVFLNIKQPKVFDAEGKDGWNGWHKLKQDVGYDTKYGTEAIEAIAGHNRAARMDQSYDGIIAKNIADIHSDEVADYLGDVFLVFDENPNQIKSATDNTGEFSAEDADIRFKTDTQGRSLSREQQEFFANSKAVDKDGNLLVLYHGTPRAGFTEFKSGWFTTSKEDAISYSGDRKGRMFDPNEKYEPETLSAGDFRLGYMTFDSEEDRAAFIAEHPTAESAMSESEYENARIQAEDEEYDALTERKPELQKIWDAYREYERDHFVDTTIGEILNNPDAYTEDDLRRAVLAYDSNAVFDSIDELETTEERKSALVESLNYMNEDAKENGAEGILDMVVATRVPRNGEGVKHNDLGNRTYEVYARIERPYEIDANGRGSEFESGDIYQSVKDALADEQYDGVIIRNWRVGRHQQLGDVVVPKYGGNQVKLTSNENPTESESTMFKTTAEDYAAIPVDGQVEKEGTTLFKTTGTPTEQVVKDGLVLSIEDFTNLAGNIFSAMPEDVRRKVVENAARTDYDLKKATLQMSASLAEKRELTDEEIELAKMVAQKVEDAVLASGVEMTRPFTTNEALWMLYQSTYPTSEYDLIGNARKAVVANNLGMSQSQQAEQEKDADNIRFRSARGAASNSAAAMYNNEQRYAWGMLRETYQDMYRSVKSLMQAIEKATGKVAQSWENILTSLNALSSKNLADKKKYLRDFLTPMWDAALAIRDKYHKSLEQIERYLMVKHGLERNKVLAARDARNFYREQADQEIAAIKADKSLSKAEQKTRIQKVEDTYDNHVSDIEAGIDAKFQEFRAKDYGGLTALFSDFADYGTREDYESEELYQEAALAARTPKYATLAETEIAAQQEVDAFEKEVDKALVDNLWKKINAATKETLRHQYANNMLTKEQYERVRDMFEFYVPLRGFVDTTAEDTYSYYVSGQQSKFANPLQGAKGRKTQAETPLGWIGSMAESAIQMDNKNTAKLALYYFAVNRPNNDVLKITPTWYEWTGEVDADGKKIFEPVYPTYNGPQSGPAMQAQMDAFESMMEQQAQAGNAYKGKQRIDLKEAIIRAPKSAPEHVVTVKVAGEDYSIIINANPRAAQAINGMLNIDKGDNPLYRAARAILRFQASIKTSLAPLFWITNFMRDVLFAFINTSIRHDAGYTKEFAKNYPHAFRVFSYVHKNRKAALGDSKYEKYYTEFAENGGITGYTSLTNNTEYDQMMKTYANNARAGKFIKGIKGALEVYQDLGESFEQVSRFAAYITARESGKDISESIYEAKEVTINFNRKGSGKAITWEESGKMRRKNGKPLTDAERIFFVTLGGLSPVARSLFMFFNAGMQGVRMIAKLAHEHPGKSAAWAGIVFTMGLVNAIIHALAEDDDEYLDMPDYVRRTNILIGKNGTYFKWSLPHEVRPFYAMADIFVQHAMGRKPNENIAAELAETFGEWVPINPFKDGMNAFTPDIIRPFVEIKNNKDFTGSPIYREYRWLTEEQQKNMPAYEKGFDSTSKVLVDISEILNDVSGGDHTDAGFININPAVVEHLAQEYGGGPLKLAEQFFKTIGVMTGDQEFSIRNTPFLSTFMVAADDRYRNAHTTELFKYYKGMADDVKRRAGEYKADKDKEGFDKLRASDDFLIFQIYGKYEKRDKFYNEQLKRAKSDSERKDIMSLQDAHRKRMIEEISNL